MMLAHFLLLFKG